MEPTISKISYRLIASIAVNIQARNLRHSIYITSRGYSDNKSIYERLEEGKLTRVVHGQEYPEWRKPWIERDGEWKSKLAVFSDKNPSTEILNAMQKLPSLDVQAVKDWWAEMKETQEIQNQKYLPERVASLGANLAAMHFFIYRHCSVRYLLLTYYSFTFMTYFVCNGQLRRWPCPKKIMLDFDLQDLGYNDLGGMVWCDGLVSATRPHVGNVGSYSCYPSSSMNLSIPQLC